jgi:hypothetical protein
LVLQQVNCRSIYNKNLDLLNLIHTYKPDIGIGTGSRPIAEISNAEIVRADYTTFRRGRHTRGDGMLIE